MKYIAAVAVIAAVILLRWDVRVVQVRGGEDVYLIKHDRWSGDVYRCEDADRDEACVKID